VGAVSGGIGDEAAAVVVVETFFRLLVQPA